MGELFTQTFGGHGRLDFGEPELAFAQLLDTPRRVRATGAVPGKLVLAAGTSAAGTSVAVLVANLSGAAELRLAFTNLPWAGDTVVDVRIVDNQHAFETRPGAALVGAELTLKLPPPSVALVTLRLQVNK